MLINKQARNLSVIIFGILIIIFLSCTLVFAQDSDTSRFTDREKDGLLGPVKNVKGFLVGNSTPVSLFTQSYRIDGSRETMESKVLINPFIQIFDTKGREIKNEVLNQGKKELTSYRVYDDINHTFIIHFQAPDALPKDVSGKLTNDGEIQEIKHYSPTGEYLGNTLYEYNEKGLLVSMTKSLADGIPFETYNNLYDINGRVIEKNRYDASYRTYKGPVQSILAYKECYTYDTKGRLVEKRIYRGASQELIIITTYADFDKYGNATKQTVEDINSSLKGFFSPIKLMEYEYFE